MYCLTCFIRSGPASPEIRTNRSIHICSVHRILPDVYLHCKGVMIAESRKCGGKLRLMDARKLCRIDVNKTRKIYNHLVSKELVQQR
uniref:SWIRM domain-containing protein n=1 Tax=Amphimedon queenslandica TaxID=400682 RepID=A0A1X7UPV6_AMPQE